MRYLRFFTLHPLIAKLLGIDFLLNFGLWFTTVAIYALLLELKVSPFVISVVAIAQVLPGLINSPFTGSLVDKLSPKRLMSVLLAIEITMTLCLVFIHTKELLWLLCLLIFVRMSAGFMYYAALMSLMPKLLKGEELQMANEVGSILWSATFSLGAAAGGVAVYYLGIQAAILIDVGFYIVGLRLLLSAKFGHIESAATGSIVSLISEGIGYLRNNRRILTLMALHAVIGLTSYDTIVAVLADTKYKEVIAVPLSIGFLNATRAFGLFVGPSVLGKYISKANLHIFFLAQAAAIWLWATLFFNFYASLAAAFCVGFITSTLWAYTYTLVQEECEERFLGRVVSYNNMLFTAVIVTTTFLTGLRLDAGVSPEKVTSAIGVGFAAAGAWYYFGFRIRNKERA